MNFNKNDLFQQLSIDCVIFGFQGKDLKVLVPKVNFSSPIYTLPGGFIFQNESIDEAALRILKQRTGINNIYLEQFRVFGDLGRTNNEVIDQIVSISDENKLKLSNFPDLDWFRKRFISIGYYALVDIKKVVLKKGEFDEEVAWYNVKELPKMIMDHNEIVPFALEALRANLDQKLIGFNLLPEIFTMKELQELYETVYDKPYARNNFQKKILDLNVLERLEKKFTGAANKAPYQYRFKK